MHHENGSLAHRITEILRTSVADDREMLDAIESLASENGEDTYDEFFYVLTGKRFGAGTAVKHWRKIILHVYTVIRPSYCHEGFLPSVLHYMQREADILVNPRFIEADYIANIQRSSITDGLTGLYNQTFFKISLSKLINQASHHTVPPFAVILFDLDHFKQYNDTSGHLAGDHALKRVANILLENLRESDIASRYGGEEFALLMPHSSRVLASNVAQRIRLAIEAEIFPGQERLSSANLTISGGIAEYPHDAENAEALIEIADAELYKAKIRRNCIYPSEENRRVSTRRPLRSLVKLSPDKDGDPRTGISLDVSEFGMALGCDNPLLVGSSVDLHFNQPFWNCNCLLNGTVRQARKLGDMNFIGIEFDQTFFGNIDGPLSYLDDHHHRKKTAQTVAAVEMLPSVDRGVCSDEKRDSD